MKNNYKNILVRGIKKDEYEWLKNHSKNKNISINKMILEIIENYIFENKFSVAENKYLKIVKETNEVIKSNTEILKLLLFEKEIKDYDYWKIKTIKKNKHNNIWRR